MSTNHAIVLCDDLIFASKITTTARALGLSVAVAKTPETLLRQAAERSPSCVLLDLQNPGLDLLALLPHLRAYGSRVIGYGSHVDVETLKAARLAGCDRVLPRSQFVKELESKLAEWLAPMDINAIIRPAKLTDADALVHYNMAIALETEHIVLDKPTVTAGVAAVLADPSKGLYTVAEIAGEMVGQLMVTFEYSDWRNGYFWWVQSVYVRPDARRRGLFRALFNHVRDAAIANPEVIGLRLYVERENGRAQQTYASLGMTEEPYNLYGIYPLPGRATTLRSNTG